MREEKPHDHLRRIYNAWKADPDGFWMQQAEAIDWDRKPSKALFDDNAPLYEWFSDGMVNTCWNAVDRHVEAGRGEQAAIIHDSPVTHSKREISYVELRNRVAMLAGALRAKGVEKGDRVIIYMPMIPEAVIAMLACARLGAIHSVVFGGFAATNWRCASTMQTQRSSPPHAVSKPGRIRPLQAASGRRHRGIATHKPDFCVIFQREQEVAELKDGRDVDWHGFQYGGGPADCVPVRATTPPTSSIPPAPPASPRASSAPPAGTWWRSTGP